MKRTVLAFLLGLWMALSLLPLTVRAEGSYEISAEVVEGEAHGCVELAAESAAAGETVWLAAEPGEGYLVRIEGFCASRKVRVTYGGLGSYAITMPEGDVELQIRFVPAGEASYTVTGTVNRPDWGELIIRRSSAREGEWVVVEAVPRPGCMLAGMTALGSDGGPVKGGYADTRDGVLIYEYCIPDVDLVIEAEFAEDPENIVWKFRQLRGQMIRLMRQVAQLWL